MWPLRKKYIHDAFLSHAFEDKGAIADELYRRLHAEKLKIWYSTNGLVTGGDISDDIEKAIDNSRFGVVVFSEKFHEKDWTNRELSWLQKKEAGKQRVILTVLHEMTIERLSVINPRMATKFCINGSRGMDYVVDKIIEEIKKEQKRQKDEQFKSLTLFAIMASILILLISSIAYLWITDVPKEGLIQNTIEVRIQKLAGTIENRHLGPFKLGGAFPGDQAKIDSARSAYENIKSYFRNEYQFSDGTTTIRGRKNVETYLGLNVVDLAGTPGYGMDSLDIYWSDKPMIDGFRQSSFSVVNNRPVGVSYKRNKTGSICAVEVHYTNGIRYINVILTVPPTAIGTKRHEMTLLGFRSSEIYYFEKAADGEWYFKEVQ